MSLLWPHHAQGSRSCRYGSFRPKWHRDKLWSAQFRPPLNSERLPAADTAAAASSSVVRTTFDKTSFSPSPTLPDSLSSFPPSWSWPMGVVCITVAAVQHPTYVAPRSWLPSSNPSAPKIAIAFSPFYSLHPPCMHPTLLPPSNLITLPADREFGTADGSEGARKEGGWMDRGQRRKRIIPLGCERARPITV